MALMCITKMEMKAAVKEAKRQKKYKTCSTAKQAHGN